MFSFLSNIYILINLYTQVVIILANILNNIVLNVSAE